MAADRIPSHLQVARYGDFSLTDAIRPGRSLQVVPRAGYRISVFRDRKRKLEVPVLAAAVSAERLFDVFLDLLDPLGAVVDVILETSHRSGSGKHRDRLREDIDLPVLKSDLLDHEDLLLNDGCTGIAVLSKRARREVQFDEHKLVTVYARNLRPFERVLKECGLRRDEQLQFITEAEHLHHSQERFQDEFGQLCYRLGIGEPVEHVNW